MIFKWFITYKNNLTLKIHINLRLIHFNIFSFYFLLDSKFMRQFGFCLYLVIL